MAAHRWASFGRWLRAEAPFVVVLLALSAPVPYLVLQPNHWRRGSGVVATALLLAAMFRALLPSNRIGLLAVRGRVLDTFFLALMGGVVLAVGIRLH